MRACSPNQGFTGPGSPLHARHAGEPAGGLASLLVPGSQAQSGGVGGEPGARRRRRCVLGIEQRHTRNGGQPRTGFWSPQPAAHWSDTEECRRSSASPLSLPGRLRGEAVLGPDVRPGVRAVAGAVGDTRGPRVEIGGAAAAPAGPGDRRAARVVGRALATRAVGRALAARAVGRALAARAAADDSSRFRCAGPGAAGGGAPGASRRGRARRCGTRAGRTSTAATRCS